MFQSINNFTFKKTNCSVLLFILALLLSFCSPCTFAVFMGFVFIISSLVILHSDNYMFGYLNIVRFILLVLIFVVVGRWGVKSARK